MLKNLFLPGMLLGGVLCLASCSTDERSQNESAQLQIALTDDPGDFREVWIDVKEIRINMTDQDDQGWTVLPGVHAGAYNLLDLVNDKDTVLVDAVIPDGKIGQIRLILGDNNYIITNSGQKIMLETPSAQQSGLKLNIHQAVVGGVVNKLLLDFDVARSIVHTGNGKHILKPVIRAILQAIGGSVKGVVLPDSTQTAVLAIRGADTIASSYSMGGNYRIRSIDPGTYDLHFIPTDTTLQSFVKPAVVVNLGQVTTVDTVRLVKK